MEVVLGLALVIVLAGAVLAFLHLQRRRDPALASVDELAGRLSQMAETQAAGQAQLAQRMQEQERALSRALEDRLGQVTTRVSETLEKNTTQQRGLLDALTERLIKIDAAQKNISELSTQVVGLQDILANKQARGAFGELQLRDLVEAVLPPSAYAFQAKVGDNKRADCMLILPNPPGSIVIDAKYPLEAYRALMAAQDPAARKQAERAFSADVLKHVRDIADKYIVAGETAESALMFLPSEAVYAELHANFADVIEQSYKARVFIVSPTTLWATLNTVRAVLKDVRMREAAGVIQKEVLRLLEDVDRLDKRVGKLQNHFDQSVEDIRQIRISTDKVKGRGEKIQDLQFEDDEPVEQIAGTQLRLERTG